jgi:hypothetical protein
LVAATSRLCEIFFSQAEACGYLKDYDFSAQTKGLGAIKIAIFAKTSLIKNLWEPKLS